MIENQTNRRNYDFKRSTNTHTGKNNIKTCTNEVIQSQIYKIY